MTKKSDKSSEYWAALIISVLFGIGLFFYGDNIYHDLAGPDLSSSAFAKWVDKWFLRTVEIAWLIFKFVVVLSGFVFVMGIIFWGALRGK